jgi:hypothetical protein
MHQYRKTGRQLPSVKNEYSSGKQQVQFVDMMASTWKIFYFRDPLPLGKYS